MQPLDERNQKILERNIVAYNQIEGPRVGDFLRLPRISKHQKHEFTRFAHGWDDHIQTGDGSFHLGDGYVSFSGGLDPGVQRDDIVVTTETRLGSCWFFKDDFPGAGRGLYVQAEFRVFELREGANIDGLWCIQAPSVNIRSDETIKQYNCSRYKIYERASFDTLDDFKMWLAKNDLACDSFDVGHHRLRWTA